MIEDGVYTVLKNNAGVSTLVGARIYPSHLPQKPTFPAVSFTRISTFDRAMHHAGAAKVAKARFQISSWGDTPTAAKNLAVAVRRAIHGFRGTVGAEKLFQCEAVNELDLFDIDLGYQIVLDVMVSFRET